MCRRGTICRERFFQLRAHGLDETAARARNRATATGRFPLESNSARFRRPDLKFEPTRARARRRPPRRRRRLGRHTRRRRRLLKPRNFFFVACAERLRTSARPDASLWERHETPPPAPPGAAARTRRTLGSHVGSMNKNKKGKRKGAYADASGGDSLTWRRRACGEAHDESSADTLCGSWTRGAGSPQAAWYSWPFGDTNSQRPRSD